MSKIEEMQSRLNELYWKDSDEYRRQLDLFKSKGYKIFRNSKGQHKVENILATAFGGAFKTMFDL